MTQLCCNAENCFYNKSECCCKGDISVEGDQDWASDDTCCSSFRERGIDSYTDSSIEPKREIEVSCDAVNCVYNDNYSCGADRIGISGKNASVCDQTACATFQEK